MKLIIVSSLLIVLSLSVQAFDLSLKSNTWQMESNYLTTDINTSSLDDKNITRLWRYKDNQWYFYSSDKSLQSTVDYPLIETLKPSEAFWIYSEIDQNISINPDVEQLYLVPFGSSDISNFEISKENDVISIEGTMTDSDIFNSTKQDMNFNSQYNSYFISSGDENIIIRFGEVGTNIFTYNQSELLFLATKKQICNDSKLNDINSLIQINSINKKQIICE
jgi:hypothetical protein